MSNSNQLRNLWKPNGKHVDAPADRALRAWMRDNGLATAPGAVTMLLHDKVHDLARKHAVKALSKSGRS